MTKAYKKSIHLSGSQLSEILAGATEKAEEPLIRAANDHAAKMLEKMDLVITADTCIAHLAGAMGLPVLVLLSKACDWRWLESGESTGWYPTMRLFRQEKLGDWEEVFREARNHLCNFEKDSHPCGCFPLLRKAAFLPIAHTVNLSCASPRQ